ncbi:MAG: FTR1 family protein, partial [Bdellovibrionales bacterium]|nr:FTR1 family protein [Bdellovibrionales bacterium]
MRIFLLMLPLHLWSLVIVAQQSAASSPEIVVHLLDYLAKDYGGAVQDGKVISESEYAEQVEFGRIVQNNSIKISAFSNDKKFVVQVSELAKLIQQKGSPEDVANLARKLQQDAIKLADLQIAPKTWPNISLGAKLYQQNCVACHGTEARGDGPAGASLDPKPSNFHDADLVRNSAPYKYYNTIRLGVPGTGMSPFPQLSDKDVWALAFYLKSLGYKHAIGDAASSFELDLKDVATLTDAEIIEKFKVSRDESLGVLASIRMRNHDSIGGNPLDIASVLLDRSVDAAEAGNFSEASTLALRSYLEGIEPVEPRVKASLPGYAERLEGLMSSYRSALDKGAAIQDIRLRKIAASEKIAELKNLLADKQMSPAVAFGAAFSIFLREGFEAVLIIVVLISILTAMGQKEETRWIHVGWISAVIVGCVAWVASGALISMSGLSRELLEGAISLAAVSVLIYVGFWLHRYSEVKKWRNYLETRLQRGLAKNNYLGLAAVAFFAVFREAFEVVLFLRAIWIDLDSSGKNMAGAGVLASLALLLVLSWFSIRESRKLPVTLLFQICSWTMMALAFILTGKGIHSLQEAGIIRASTLPTNFRIDLLGIYPTGQT